MIRPAALILLAAASLTAEPREFRMRNGLRVILEERPNEFGLRMHLRVGLTPGEASLARIQGLVGHLNRGGAAGATRAALDRRLADLGLTLGLKADPHGLDWSLSAASPVQEEAFEALASVVFRPDLGGSEPQDEAPKVDFRTWLGFPGPGEGGLSLPLAERLALHRRVVRPERAVLLIQGDLSLATARQLALLSFGTWAPAPEPPGPAKKDEAAPAAESGVWAGVPDPGGSLATRAQGLAVALLLEAWARSEPDPVFLFEAARFGLDAGALSFRLRQGMREDLRARIEALRGRPVTEADLEGVKTRWKAERAGLELHPAERLAALARIALEGDLGPDLLALRPEELRRALEARLDPARLVFAQSVTPNLPAKSR